MCTRFQRHRSTLGSTRRPRGRGQSLVEFALVIPIFVLVLVGILDFGWMLYCRMTVIDAAREGARYGIAVPPASWGSMQSLVTSTVQSEAPGLALSNLTDTVTCVPIVSKTSCDFNAAGDAQPGDAIKVTVTYQFYNFFPAYFGSTVSLPSTVQMVLE